MALTNWNKSSRSPKLPKIANSSAGFTQERMFWGFMSVTMLCGGLLITGVISHLEKDMANTWLYLGWTESGRGTIVSHFVLREQFHGENSSSSWINHEYMISYLSPDGKMLLNRCYNPNSAYNEGESAPIVHTRYWPYYAVLEGSSIKPRRSTVNMNMPFFLCLLPFMGVFVLPPFLCAWWFNRKEKVVKRFYLLLFAGSLVIPAMLHGVPALMKLFR